MLTTPRDFRSVRATVVEGNSHLRSDMRLALLEKGIREPTTHRTVDSFMEQAGRELLDLVVCDTDTFEGDFVQAMQRIRQNAMGGNPFAVVIATVGDASLDAVQTALNGGVDDLMRKPASAKAVVDRIDHLVRERKPFIATRHYVGPSRTALSGGAEDGELIAVPNTLRNRVVHKATDADVKRVVAQAAIELKEKISEHPLAAIERLIRRTAIIKDANEIELMRHFADLQALSLEMSGHYRSAGFAHIADLAKALAKLARRIGQQKPPEPTQTDRDLLNQLGIVIQGAMTSAEGSKATIQEIAAMVDRYAGGSTPRAATYH
jgi:DNA-binding response OmpR family regulator